MDWMDIANSFPMWIAAAVAVGLAIFQAILFARESYSTGLEMGLSSQQMKGAMRSSLITSIGPSIVILTGLLALLVSVGGPMAWMRLSYIGSIMFELMAVGFGAEATGVRVGVDPMTEMAFANAVWTMILGSIGWILFSALFTDKMAVVQDKVVKGSSALLAVISTAAILGAFAALVSPHILAMNRNTVAALSGGAIMLVLSIIMKKKPEIKWLKEWALAFALFGGMIVAALV